MKKYQNESTVDRVIRLVVSVVLVLIAHSLAKGALQTLFYVLGAISFITSITGFCGIYEIFKISTLSKNIQ